HDEARLGFFGCPGRGKAARSGHVSACAEWRPNLLLLRARRRRCWVLDLQPVTHSARAIQRAEPLRHDALAAERAGMLVDDGAVIVIVPIERDAISLLVQQIG